MADAPTAERSPPFPPTMSCPKCGAGTGRAAGSSPASTGRSRARRMTRSCRSASIRCSFIRSARPTGRRSASCWRSCWPPAMRAPNMTPGSSTSAKATSSVRASSRLNPNSKIPALLDRTDPGQPQRVFESGAILLYLAEKFGAFLPKDPAARTEALSWLFWQMGAGPFVGGGFGHFYAYAPVKIQYAIDRYAMEVKRQYDVLDRHLAEQRFMAGRRLQHRRHGDLALVRRRSRWARPMAIPRPSCRRGPVSAFQPLGRRSCRTAGGPARPAGQPQPDRG